MEENKENVVTEEMKENMAEAINTDSKKTHKKAIIAIIIVLVLVLALGGILAYLYVENNKTRYMTVLETSKSVEYGNAYNFVLSDYIEITENVEYEITGEIQNEENKEYPAVGTYTIIVSADNYESVEITVTVSDTTMPSITLSEEEISIEQGTNLDECDFNQYITVEDLSETTSVEIDKSNVNTEEVGEYIVTISVSDIYDNTSTAELKVNIIEKEEEEVAEETATTTTSSTSSNKSSSSSSTSSSSGSTSTASTSTSSGSSSNSSSGSTASSSSSSSTSSSSSSTDITSDETVAEEGIYAGTATMYYDPDLCASLGYHIYHDGTKASAGNTGKWYATQQEGIDDYEATFQYWFNLWRNGEIDEATCDANCPVGYECWMCETCHYWTFNYYYDYD